MFKYLFSILFFTTTLFSVTPYEKCKEDFKSNLYYKQDSLIDDKRIYYDFIEEFLQKGEKTLAVINYCIKNKDDVKLFEDTFINQYFTNLCRCNVSAFYHFLNPKNKFKYGYVLSEYNSSKESLKVCIQNIKDKYNLNIDFQKELDATFKLLDKASAKYYTKLAFHKRLLLWAI